MLHNRFVDIDTFGYRMPKAERLDEARRIFARPDVSCITFRSDGRVYARLYRSEVVTTA